MKNKCHIVENIVRKGEIACCKQFLLFSQCFPQLYILVRQNAVLCGNGNCSPPAETENIV